MIIVMQPHAGEEDVRRVVATIRQQGLSEHVSRGTECTIIGAVGDERVFDVAQIEALPGVERAIRIVQEWRLGRRHANHRARHPFRRAERRAPHPIHRPE